MANVGFNLKKLFNHTCLHYPILLSAKINKNKLYVPAIDGGQFPLDAIYVMRFDEGIGQFLSNSIFSL